MKLKPNVVFLAMTNNNVPLLCLVNEIKNNVAYCDVINGGWQIGFNTQTLEMCHKGTHPYVQKHLKEGYGAKVVLTDWTIEKRRSWHDYNGQIADALYYLKNKKD